MAATNAKLNLLTLWSLIRMLMMSLAWQLLVCHHRLMLEQHSTFSTTKIINNPLKINRNVSPCQSKKTTKLLHTLQYPALPEHHSLKDSLMVILAMEPVWHLGSYRWPLYLDTEEIQLHSSWQSKKKLNFTICLRKQGLKKQQKKTHGFVYIKMHVHTLDLKCLAWGIHIQSVTVQDWKSIKGSYGKIITTLVPVSILKGSHQQIP